MPHVIKTAKTRIVTKNGECELSINVEPIVVEITVNVVGGSPEIKAQATEADDPKVLVAPEFGKNPFGAGKINFGKNA